MFCDDEHSLLDTREYWFGLYKLTATQTGTTAWYDGNPSTYRDWSADEPNTNAICMLYTNMGFKDRSCLHDRYYTCKKRAGNLYTNHLLRQLFMLLFIVSV